METLNFTQPSNNEICPCGNHHGVGEWSPYKRAAVYCHMRNILPDIIQPYQTAYLESWEKAHGPVTIETVWTEKNDKKWKINRYREVYFKTPDGQVIP